LYLHYNIDVRYCQLRSCTVTFCRNRRAIFSEYSSPDEDIVHIETDYRTQYPVP
jgi:hypothetical protein